MIWCPEKVLNILMVAAALIAIAMVLFSGTRLGVRIGVTVVLIIMAWMITPPWATRISWNQTSFDCYEPSVGIRLDGVVKAPCAGMVGIAGALLGGKEWRVVGWGHVQPSGYMVTQVKLEHAKGPVKAGDRFVVRIFEGQEAQEIGESLGNLASPSDKLEVVVPRICPRSG
jgi:hypothetical protein